VRRPEQGSVSPEGYDQIPRLLRHRLGAVSKDRSRSEVAKCFFGSSEGFLVDLMLVEKAGNRDIAVFDELLEPLLVAPRVPLVRALLVYDEDSGTHSLLSTAYAGVSA
jgi:hypothetical protein